MDWGIYSHHEFDAFHEMMMSMDELDQELKVFYGPDAQLDVVSDEQHVTFEQSADHPGGAKEVSQLDQSRDAMEVSATHNDMIADAMEVDKVAVEDDVMEAEKFQQPHPISREGHAALDIHDQISTGGERTPHAQTDIFENHNALTPNVTTNGVPQPELREEIITDAPRDFAQQVPSIVEAIKVLPSADPPSLTHQDHAAHATTEQLPNAGQLSDADQLPDADAPSTESDAIAFSIQQHVDLQSKPSIEAPQDQKGSEDLSDEFEEIDSDIMPESAALISRQQQPDRHESHDKAEQDLDLRRDSFVQTGRTSISIKDLLLAEETGGLASPLEQEARQKETIQQEREAVVTSDAQNATGSESPSSRSAHVPTIEPPQGVASGTLTTADTPSAPFLPPANGHPHDLETEPILPGLVTIANTEEQKVSEMPTAPALEAPAVTSGTADIPGIPILSSVGKKSLFSEMRDEEVVQPGRVKETRVSFTLQDQANRPVVAEHTTLIEEEFEDIPSPTRLTMRRSFSNPDMLENIAMAQQKAKDMARRLSEPPAPSPVGSGTGSADMDLDEAEDVQMEEPKAEESKMIVDIQAPARKPTKKAATAPRKKAATKKGKGAPQTRRTARKATAKQLQDPQKTGVALGGGIESSGFTFTRKRAVSKGATDSTSDAGGKRRKITTENSDVSMLENDEVVDGHESGADSQTAVPAIEDAPTDNDIQSDGPAGLLPRQDEVLAAPRRVIKELAALQAGWNGMNPDLGRRNGKHGRTTTKVQDHVKDSKEAGAKEEGAMEDGEKEEQEVKEVDQIERIMTEEKPVQTLGGQAQMDTKPRKRGMAPLGKRELAGLSSPWSNTSLLEQMRPSNAAGEEDDPSPDPAPTAAQKRRTMRALGKSESPRLSGKLDQPVEVPDTADKKKPVGGHLVGKREFANLADAWSKPAASDQKGRKTRAKGEEEDKQQPNAGAAVKARWQGKGA